MKVWIEVIALRIKADTMIQLMTMEPLERRF